LQHTAEALPLSQANTKIEEQREKLKNEQSIPQKKKKKAYWGWGWNEEEKQHCFHFTSSFSH